MIRRILDRLFRREMLFNSSGEVYMERWIVFRRPSGRGVYIHHFIRSDDRRAPHDHPAAFISIGISGRYTEEYWGLTDEYDLFEDPQLYKVETLTAPWIRRFPATYLHRINVDRGCWTLVYHGKNVRDWGFVTVNGIWWDWRDCLSEDDQRRGA